jgi:hypothetical protein
LSAFGGFHDSFYRTGEDVILKGVTDLTVPIIHEGNVLKGGIESLKTEHQYIIERLDIK